MEIINLYKKIGETPLKCLERFRTANPRYKDKSMTYLGRLDPLAEGVLLVGVGEITQSEREVVMKLDKAYRVEALLGFSTDSYDILGLVEKVSVLTKVVDETVASVLANFVGTWDQPYPPYSSKPVSGKAELRFARTTKPLFTWAREGKLGQIEIPNKEVKIKKISLLKIETIRAGELLTEIEGRVALVKGDFRQKEIIARWRQMIGELGKETLVTKVKFETQVSSGTYVRALVNRLGQELGFGATTLSILREQVGGYRLNSH